MRVKVANSADPAGYFEEDFWIDTSALYSFMPEDKLKAIGVDSLRSREVVLADGHREHRLFGEARLTIESLAKP